MSQENLNQPQNILNIDQEFQPFDDIKPVANSYTGNVFRSWNSLQIKTLPILNTHVEAIGDNFANAEVRREFAFTPFKPEEGANITYRNGEPLITYDQTKGSTFDNKDFPNNILAGISREVLYEAKLLTLRERTDEDEDDEEYYAFKPEVLPIFSNLRFQLIFPNGLTFEAKPDGHSFTIGDVMFSEFYPIDLEEFNNPYHNKAVGLEIRVPDTISALSQIRAKFVLSQINDYQTEHIENPAPSIAPISGGFIRAKR
jgi:hypothetical protein